MNERACKLSPKDRARRRRWCRENRDKVRLDNRRWYDANRDRQRERMAAYREQNRAKAVAAVTAWREKNPNYQREWRQRDRMRKAWATWAKVCAASRARLANARDSGA